MRIKEGSAAPASKPGDTHLWSVQPGWRSSQVGGTTTPNITTYFAIALTACMTVPDCDMLTTTPSMLRCNFIYLPVYPYSPAWGGVEVCDWCRTTTLSKLGAPGSFLPAGCIWSYSLYIQIMGDRALQ